MESDESGIPLVTDEISIKAGMDADGNHIYSTKFIKSGSTDLIDYITGLGLLEAAKADFQERWSSS